MVRRCAWLCLLRVASEPQHGHVRGVGLGVRVVEPVADAHDVVLAVERIVGFRLGLSIRFDLDQSKIDLYTVGLGYLDECFGLMGTYTYDNTNFLIQRADNRFMARITLRTLSSPDTPTGITTLGPTAGAGVITTQN